MWLFKYFSARRVAYTAVPLLAVSAGCCNDRCHTSEVEKCADIPRGAIPQPVGTYSCQWQTAHMERADQDKYVIYENEWREGGVKLGPFGQRHIDSIAEKLPTVSDYVIIEPHFDLEKNAIDQQLNETRRQEVVAMLNTRGIADADRRVVIAWPWAEGMHGVEGVQVGNRLFGGNASGGGSGGQTVTFQSSVTSSSRTTITSR